VINRGLKSIWLSIPEKSGIIRCRLSKLNQYEKKPAIYKIFYARRSELTVRFGRTRAFAKAFIRICRHQQRCGVLCQLNKIEVWARNAYEAQMDNEPENFANLAEEVMG
jgi:MraZ protein